MSNFKTKSDCIPQEQKFMTGLLDEFKDFVLDAMFQEIHNDFEDHHEFLKMALNEFIEMQMTAEDDF